MDSEKYGNQITADGKCMVCPQSVGTYLVGPRAVDLPVAVSQHTVQEIGPLLPKPSTPPSPRLRDRVPRLQFWHLGVSGGRGFDLRLKARAPDPGIVRLDQEAPHLPAQRG
jgi:hypothetical protein